MKEKFTVDLRLMPDYFENFLRHCNDIADENNWDIRTVINYQLRPLGGRLITTKMHGRYLRWDTEEAHTFFVLRWG